MKIARGALGSTPLTVLNYTSQAMATQLKHLLDEGNYDVVQVESIHLAEYIPLIRAARSNPIVVCDWHNIESDLMRQYSNRASNPLRRIYARRTADQLSTLERKIADSVDANVMVSEPDRVRLLHMAPGARAFVIENGVDVKYYSEEEIEKAYLTWREANPGGGSSSGEITSPASNATCLASSENGSGRNRILFVGSMDYHANIDGVRHFAASVWPRLLELMPRTVLTIVGRNPPPPVRDLARLRGVEVTGTVEDVRPYYREALASVIPLQVGGGSRLKIYEALAAGVPVISTRLGAEGVDARDGESIIFAETPDEFCRAISDVAEDNVRWQQLAAAGRRLVSAKYDWSILGKQLVDIHKSLLSEYGGKAIT
jgi:glycosyltransferase involved in cell wall biosynthesis